MSFSILKPGVSRYNADEVSRAVGPKFGQLWKLKFIIVEEP